MRGIILVFLGASSYGVLSTIVKLAYKQGFDLGEVTGIQILIGFIALWSIVVVQALKEGTRLPDFSSRTVWKIVIAGIPTGATSVLYYKCVQYVPASLAILLLFQFTWMGMVLEAIVERKLPSKERLFALLLLISGTVLAAGVLQNGMGSFDPQGVIYGLGAAFSYSLFILLNGKVGNSFPATQKSAIMLSGALLFIFTLFPPVFLVNGAMGSGLLYYGLPLALFGTIIPPLFFAIGIPKTGVGLASILNAAELPVAVLCGALILQEDVSAIQWLGVLIIFLGVALPNIPTKKLRLLREKA